MRVLIINGANVNMLGKRDVSIYGAETYADLCGSLEKIAREHCADLEIFHSNSEGEIIDKLQTAKADAVIINAGAYSHYSYAIRDALADLNCPKIEVHLSNIFARDGFRRESVLAPACTGIIAGLGGDGYRLALRKLLEEK